MHGRRKRQPVTSPYFAADTPPPTDTQRVSPEHLQSRPRIPAAAATSSRKKRRQSTREPSPPPQESPPPPIRAPSEQSIVEDESIVLDFAPPAPVKPRCALHEAIIARETNFWRTTAIFTATAPYLRQVRLRSVLGKVSHKVYQLSFSRPQSTYLAVGGGEGRISIFPTISLSSYNNRNPSSEKLTPVASFVGTSII